MPADITAIRETIAGAVTELPGVSKRVTLGPSEYRRSAETNFLVTIVVGTPTLENEELVDQLFNAVPDAIDARAPQLGAYVTRCSGHRLYADSPEAPPLLGCEWTVKVLT